jgi:hypothetical protein
VIRLLDWLDRTWPFDLPVGAFPAVLERLRGTPARAEELVAGAHDDHQLVRGREALRAAGVST